MKISLKFVNSVSDAYEKKLLTFADKILAQGITKNRPPTIRFSGMNRETYDEIKELKYAYYERYELN